MAKKTTPIITHNEIICYAIFHIETEIVDWKKRGEQLKEVGNDEIAKMAAEHIAHLTPKLDALKEMYRFETGHEYC